MTNVETKGLFTIEELELAWERVCASVGSDVKDYFGINVFDSNARANLQQLFEELDNNKYQPTRPFKYFEPKKCGTQRTKSVLRIKDAIIYQGIANKIGEALYSKLSESRDSVFGSVLNENVKRGVELLEDDDPDFYFFEYYVSLYNRFIEGVTSTLESGEVQYKLETDITGFFDSIPHSIILLTLYKYKIDKQTLDLLGNCLNTWSGTRDKITLNVGIPQGPPASFLLANVLLDELDRDLSSQNLKYFRFMDDIRVYAETEDELLDVLVYIDRYLKGNSLSLNASKTNITTVDSNDGEDIMLDPSGVPFEENLLEEEHEIIVQDETQLKRRKLNSVTLPTNSALKLKYNILLVIEDDLLELYEMYNGLTKRSDLSHAEVRSFLTLSQRWRSLATSLKEHKSYAPNKKLVKVWFFGIKHIFWKANSMAWNLKVYEELEEFASEYEHVLKQFNRFEWVKYQLLNVFYKFYPNNSERHRKAIRDLHTESSPLVRLGYFSVLIEAIKDNSRLFESYSNLLKDEKDEYVKDSVLSAIHYKNLQVSINQLKEWFLK